MQRIIYISELLCHWGSIIKIKSKSTKYISSSSTHQIVEPWAFNSNNSLAYLFVLRCFCKGFFSLFHIIRWYEYLSFVSLNCINKLKCVLSGHTTSHAIWIHSIIADFLNCLVSFLVFVWNVCHVGYHCYGFISSDIDIWLEYH